MAMPPQLISKEELLRAILAEERRRAPRPV
jgi:hypothetical protein